MTSLCRRNKLFAVAILAFAGVHLSCDVYEILRPESSGEGIIEIVIGQDTRPSLPCADAASVKKSLSPLAVTSLEVQVRKSDQTLIKKVTLSPTADNRFRGTLKVEAQNNLTVICIGCRSDGSAIRCGYDDDVDVKKGGKTTAVISGWDQIFIPQTMYIAPKPSTGTHTVSWTACSSAASYELQEAENPLFAGAINYKGDASLSMTFKSRPLGTYFYHVRAVNGYGIASCWSVCDSVTVIKATPKYTLTMAANNQSWGTTSPSIDSNEEYDEGAMITVTATPKPGYRFVSWTGSVADASSATTTVTMDGDKTVTANFEPIQYILTVVVNNSDWGTTTPAIGTQTYESGSIVTISATPASGYRFVGWTGEVADPSRATTTVKIDGFITVKANFVRVYMLTMAVNNSEWGTTTPAIGTKTYDSGSIVTITAISAAGSRFVGWIGDVADQSSATTTVTMDGGKTVSANFVRVYTLTMAVNQLGWGTTSPAAGTYTYDSGATVTVTAIPASGYRFLSWTGGVADVSSATTTVTIDVDKTVTANFVRVYTLTMALNNSDWGATNPAVGENSYDSGSPVTITAIPASGYKFVNWTGNVANPSSESTTLIMNGDMNVTANFMEIRHALTIDVVPAGSGDTDPTPGAREYRENEVVSIRAIPAEGFRFVNWTGSVADVSSATTTVTIDVDKTVTANFVRVYTLTMAVNNANFGTTNPAVGAHSIDSGSSVTITAIPASGYQFVNWTGNVVNPSSEVTTLIMNGEMTVTANFREIRHVLTIDVVPAVAGDTDPTPGAWEYRENEVVTIRAIPAEGFRFVRWTGSVGDTGAAETTVKMTVEKHVTANFARVYTLTMALNNASWGTTNPTVGEHSYDSGSSVTITAIPASGYRFVSWTGEVANTASATTTVFMNGDMAVTANFEEVRHVLTLDVVPAGSGDTDPAPGDRDYLENEVVTIRAIPAEGFRFVNWTGSVADISSATTTVTIDRDKTVRANFVRVCTLTVAVNNSDWGTTNPAVGEYSYDSGSSVTITAIPASGYQFISWTGEVANTSSATTTVTISDNMMVTANFIIYLPMVSIPSGTFQMGREGIASPAHTVRVSGFEISVCEITQGQYTSVIGTNPSYFKGNDARPVECVSWSDAIVFCNALSAEAGLEKCYNEGTGECNFSKNGYRLPTEAEWEYACRAGTSTAYYTGSTESDLDRAGWYWENWGEVANQTHVVGEKEQNAFGLCDMHGNAMELCNDWYDSGYYSSSPAVDPTGPISGSERVGRGGSYYHNSLLCQSAYRSSIQPDMKALYIGFRVARRP